MSSMIAALAFVVEPVVGGIIYLLSGILDTLDGAVSRNGTGDTRSGAFLDSLLDRYAEFIVLLGVLGFYARVDSLSTLLAFLVVLASFGSWMVSYSQARAEGLGSSCTFGFFERPERVLLLSAGAIASPWVGAGVSSTGFLGARPILGVTLIVLAVGTNVTALTRLWCGFREIRKEDQHRRMTEQVSGYLESRFPSHELTREWDPSSRLFVFRLTDGEKAMLLELSSEVVENADDRPWGERLEEWKLPSQLRDHSRLRITPTGLEPLPWKQLASKEDPLDERVRESFPASDPTPPSSVS